MVLYLGGGGFAQAEGRLVIFCQKWGMAVWPSMGLYSREFGTYFLTHGTRCIAHCNITLMVVN